MRVLESAPSRYDRGIRLLIRGGVDAPDRRAIYRRAGRINARLLKSSSATITTR